MSVQLGAQAEERAFAAVTAYLEGLAEHRSQRVAEAEDTLAVEREALAAYERDGAVPLAVARPVWVEVCDDATYACSRVMHGQADRSFFDEAKAAREAVRRWLHGVGALSDAEDPPPFPASEADEELGRRRIEEGLRTRVADAHAAVADRRTELAGVQDAIASFAEDRTVPADHVEGLWVHITDLVAQAASDYLEDRGEAAAVDDTKAVRGVVQHWLQQQGQHIDTSRSFMADLPR